MSWQVIARQEGRLASDATAIRFLVGLLLVVCALAGYVYPLWGDEPHTTAHFSEFIAGWMGTLVPLIGLVLGYNAIVSERESGSLLLSLSMPHSRRDVVVGNVVGRAGVLTAGILGGLLVAGGLAVYPFGELEVLPYLAFVGVTIVLGAIYTGIGVAISMLSRSKQRATVAAFGVYFLFVLVWTQLATAIEVGLSSLNLVDDGLPAILEFVFAGEPGAVYDRLIAGFIDPSQSVSGEWYLNEWTALVLLILWALLPLGLAFRRFAEVDL